MKLRNERKYKVRRNILKGIFTIMFVMSSLSIMGIAGNIETFNSITLIQVLLFIVSTAITFGITPFYCIITELEGK